MKIVINTECGGFGLSQKAYEKLNEWGIPIVDYIEQKLDPETGLYEPFAFEDQEVILQGGRSPFEPNFLWETWLRQNRSHPMLIRVVEELGDEANNHFAHLKVVEIPDDVEYEIDDYDGIETIHEVHRSWS